jgi:hypothetical protein
MTAKFLLFCIVVFLYFYYFVFTILKLKFLHLSLQPGRDGNFVLLLLTQLESSVRYTVKYLQLYCTDVKKVLYLDGRHELNTLPLY